MNKFTSLLFLMVGLNYLTYAQQWDGAAAPTGSIYRIGNVGIGTTNPTTKFEISNDNISLPFYLKVDPAAQYVQMQLSNTTTGSNTTIFNISAKRPAGQSNNGGASMLILEYDAIAVLPETGPNKSGLSLRNDDVLNGYVGFGSSNSNYSINYDSRLIELNGNPGFQYGRTNLSTGHANHFRWEFDGFEKMRITSTGRLGIGTTNPDEKLTVKGVVHAEEVRIDLNVPGPDYVFEEAYKLPPLSEVEEYIKLNKHLPEIPSAKSMEQNGVNVGELNMLLLKKIEELTLYVIALRKENEIIKQQLNKGISKEEK